MLKNKKERQKFYTHSYGPQAFSEKDVRYTKALAQIKKHIPFHDNFRVLDIGCGGGEFLSFLPTKHKYGIDISPTSVKRAREKNIDAQVIDVETQKMPFERNYFDLLVCTELLEHLFDPSLLLSEIKRVLKKGGYAYATVPNNLYWIQARVKVLFGKPFIQNSLHQPHIRFFNKKLLFELFSEAGFKVMYLGGFHYSSFPTLIEEFLAKHFTNIFVSHYSIIAKKA
jgi:SAM-dependent methyltransferase